jgi:hypothetical protein
MQKIPGFALAGLSLLMANHAWAAFTSRAEMLDAARGISLAFAMEQGTYLSCRSREAEVRKDDWLIVLREYLSEAEIDPLRPMYASLLQTYARSPCQPEAMSAYSHITLDRVKEFIVNADRFRRR